MKRIIFTLLFLSFYTHINAMSDNTPDHIHVDYYWGSICGLEILIREYMVHMPAPAPELYHIHAERIIDDWLFAHPRALAMTITDAAYQYTDVFKQLPDSPVAPELRPRFLHGILRDILEYRLTEYHKYEHDAQRASKACPAGKYR